MRKTVKLKITCRMCGKSFVNKSLFILHKRYRNLKEYPINIIQKHINFKIFENDGLPQQICKKCLHEFKSINEFIESCINNQIKLTAEFTHLKLIKTEPTDNEIDNEEVNITNNNANIKNLLTENVLEETQINFATIFGKNNPIKVEILEENVNKIENDFQEDFVNFNEISNDVDSSCNIDDDDNNDKGNDNNDKDNDNNDKDNDNNDKDNNDKDNDNNDKDNDKNDNDNNSEEYFNDNFQEDFTINCEFCNRRFDNINDLDAHQKGKHKMKLYNKYIICEQCGESVTNFRFLEHVKVVHEGKKLYNCEDCKKDFKKFRAFKEHSIKYHQSDQIQINYNDKIKYPCSECNRVYLSLGMLRNHTKNVHSDISAGSSKKPIQKSLPAPTTFQCDICNLKFRNIVSMEKHRINHVNEKYAHTFECPECARRFGRRDHLKYHIKLEHLKDKPFKCDQCDKSYVIGFQLNTHMKLVHLNDKTTRRAKCDNCDKTFHNKRYLLRHQKEVHSFEEQFICVICDAKFFKHVHLIKHAQIHNSEKMQSSNLKQPSSNLQQQSSNLKQPSSNLQQKSSNLQRKSSTEEIVVHSSMPEVTEYVVAESNVRKKRKKEIQKAVAINKYVNR